VILFFICRNAAGVFVSDLVSGGAAEREGTIRKGDQILSVNGVDLRMAGQDIAAQVLKVCAAVLLTLPS